MRYAVMFEVELGEWMYATGETMFDYNTPKLTFGSQAEAEEVRKTFNTGIIVPVEGKIRELDESERKRSFAKHQYQRKVK